MKTHKQQCIDAAIHGMIIGGFSEEKAETHRLILDMMYDAGYNEAKREAAELLTGNKENYPPVPNNFEIYRGKCPNCGISGVQGYVCPRADCPTRVYSLSDI